MKISPITLTIVLSLLVILWPQTIYTSKASTIENLQDNSQDDSNVIFSATTNKPTYKYQETMNIKYAVTNTHTNNIYIVQPTKLDDTLHIEYDIDRKSIYIVLEKVIITYHYFKYPKLIEIKPGETYTNKLQFSLNPPQEKLKNKLEQDNYSIYLSIGYFTSNGMKEMNKLRKRVEDEGLARPFNELQKIKSIELPSIKFNISSPAVQNNN